MPRDTQCWGRPVPDLIFVVVWHVASIGKDRGTETRGEFPVSGTSPEILGRCGRKDGFSMNYLRTAVLLAGLTAIFMVVGYLIGGARVR